MNIELRRRKLRRLLAAVRSNKNLSKFYKDTVKKDMKRMLTDDVYLERICENYPYDNEGNDFNEAFTWSRTDSDNVYGFSWGTVHDEIGEDVRMPFGEKPLRAGNYKVQIKPRYIEVGCQEITWEQYDSLKKAATQMLRKA